MVEKVNNTTKKNRLLTVREVAEILNSSESTVYKWIDEGLLPYIDFGMDGKRRFIRIKPEALTDLIERKSRN